jgi:hypothetical protein
MSLPSKPKTRSGPSRLDAVQSLGAHLCAVPLGIVGEAQDDGGQTAVDVSQRVDDRQAVARRFEDQHKVETVGSRPERGQDIFGVDVHQIDDIDALSEDSIRSSPSPAA